MSNKFLLSFIALLIGSFVAAQPIRKSSIKDDSTNFTIQTNYLSNYVYNGRADSLKAPYFYTTATINFANGIYASFSLNYLLTPGYSGYDFSELNLGYNYALGEKISGEVYGSMANPPICCASSNPKCAHVFPASSDLYIPFPTDKSGL